MKRIKHPQPQASTSSTSLPEQNGPGLDKNACKLLRKTTYLRKQGEMRLRPKLLDTLPPRSTLPLLRRTRRRGLALHVHLNRLKALQQADHEERHLVVGELLPEADARASVEGEEDERVGGEVFVEAVVEEAVGVELVGCGSRVHMRREMEYLMRGIPVK